MKNFRIDWPNHIIGFFSALFGIMIAFQLENWRQDSHDQALATSAFGNLKREVEINKNSLHETVRLNLETIRTVKEILALVDRELILEGTKAKADSLNRKFSNVISIDVSNSSINNRRWPVLFNMQNITIPSLQTSAWESAKATGSLSVMSYERVASLTFVYNNAKIIDEISEIRKLWRSLDKTNSKEEFSKLLVEMEKDHEIILRELNEFDQFFNMLQAME